MKFGSRRVELPTEFGTTNTDETLWVEIPVSVKEGFAKEIKELGRNDPDSRKVNRQILRLVTAWNLDGEDGKVLPLMSTLKTEKEQVAVLEQVPLPLFAFIASKVTNSDFSKELLGN